jgi:hypothetical protein
MSLKEDLLRAYSYGTGTYYAAIRSVESYQAELERTRTDYTGRSWIESPFKFPKFTDDEFEAKRVAYQAKYGTKIQVPAFADIVHWKLPTKISTDDMAAHRFAKKRKLPSPLNAEQINMLAARKYRFLKSMASPTPKWMRNIGAIQNSLDNAEDALVTAAVLGRWAIKWAPRLLGKTIPIFGWLLAGADIINLGNTFTWMRFAGNPMSCKNMDLANKNPFHRKAALARAAKMRRNWATVGEILEILQTTDQLFGVGLCLGGIVGSAVDVISYTDKYFPKNAGGSVLRYMELGPILEKYFFHAPGAPIPEASDISKFIEKYFFKSSGAPFISSQDFPTWINKYFIKDTDSLVQKYRIAEGFLAEQFRAIRGSWLLSTFKDDVPRDFHTRAYIAANTAAQALGPWWAQEDPLTKLPPLRSLKIPAPSIDNDITRDILEDQRIDPDEPQRWPHLDVHEATAEELLYTYAPMIKDSLQTYCIRYQRDYEGMIGAWSAVDFHETMLSLLSDDGEVRVGRTAYANVAQQMIESLQLIPPDTPEETIAAFADWVGAFERKTADSPKVSEFVPAGRSLGIEWMTSFPRIAFEKIEELFPGWQAIQDQIGELFVPD